MQESQETVISISTQKKKVTVTCIISQILDEL
jgi:hypothetical protein